MKRYLRFLLSLLLSAGLMISSVPLVVFADVNDFAVFSDSNAGLITLNLTDDDYGVSLMSSLGSVTNTISSSYFPVNLIFRNDSTGVEINRWVSCALENGRYVLPRQDVPSGYSFRKFEFHMDSSLMPAPSGYTFSFDYSSDISQSYEYPGLYAVKYLDNAKTETKSLSLSNYFDDLSGDIYVASYQFTLTSINKLIFYVSVPLSEEIRVVGGNFAVSFVRSDVSSSAPTTSAVVNVNDYQSDVSSSISGISSSVDEMTGEISEVADAIDALRGAMEPHYSNVLTQLHHITEQLHAFYDQIYNNIHLKEYALWQDIKTAIENIDLEVNVNLDKLKTSIDNMSTAIQNKLQAVQESITNGFNNDGINQDAAELDQSLQEYEEAEQTVLDQVNDSLNDFEFDSGFDEYTNTIKVFSDFLQELYESSGGLKVVINLSLMLSIAGIVIGVYRFKDGG